ncbi:MAG: radical SAM protein, partial [bacterium]
YWYLGPKRVVELCRVVFPDTPVILGGIYASLLPEHAREVVKPDYIITGPGEIEVSKLLSSLLKNAPAKQKSHQNLDDFPFPALDLYQKLDYIPIMTSRGCPYHCTFCATDKISGGYAQRNPELVFQELYENVNRFGIQDIAFYDDALLLNKNQRLLPILEMVIEKKMKVRFHTPNGLHARQIDKKVAKLFGLSGFRTIRLSFETVNPERFTDMKNKIAPDDLVRAVENLEQAGYARYLIETYILMGLPHQTFQEVYESILFAHSLGIKIRLASFSPIPGTVDFNRAVEDGLFPENADPLLTNKTIYPLHRNLESYRKFFEIRQFVNVLNQAVERKVNLFKPAELRQGFSSFLQDIENK